LSQGQSLDVPATISWIGTFKKTELLDKLNVLPREGALIVYTHYINDY
jgi:hypothetical protein